jgi:hypothetical protein
VSAPDPTFDVLYVPKGALPLLPTIDDPAAVLRTQVPTPFHDPDGQPFTAQAVAVTVVSMLDEPVEGVGVYTTKGALVGKPQVRTDGQEAPPPSLAKELSGHTGYGWIDPVGFDDLVSVGTWLARDYYHGSSGPYVGANLVVHLRCTGSGVDILIGGLSSVRMWPGAGGWNPYNVKLYEPGELATHPDDSVYGSFYDTYVIGQGTSADAEGTSAAGTVSFLARSPQGRTSELWHVMLMLGPRPIKTMWDERLGQPVQPAAADIAAPRAANIEDGVNRLLAASTDPNPDEAAQRRLQDASNSISIDLLDDVVTEYQKRLKALAKPAGG